MNQLFTLCYWSTKIFNLLIYCGCISIFPSLEFRAVACPVQCTNYSKGDNEIFFAYHYVLYEKLFSLAHARRGGDINIFDV